MKSFLLDKNDFSSFFPGDEEVLKAISRADHVLSSVIPHRFKEDFGMSRAKYMPGRKMKIAKQKLLEGESVGGDGI